MIKGGPLKPKTAAGDMGGLQYPILPSAAPHFSTLG